MTADSKRLEVGTKVRCLVETLLLSTGDEYTVRKVDGNVVWVWDDEEGLCDYPASYFEPAVAAAPQQQPLRIEAGRYYKTRDGRKVGPMRRSSHDDEYWWTHDDANFWHPEGRVFLTQDHPDDFIAEWVDEPPTTNADIFDELEDWMADNPLPEIDYSTTGFTVPLDAPEFGGAVSEFKVGDRVETHGDFTFDPGVGTIARVDGNLYVVTVDGHGSGWNYFANELRLVAEATSGKDAVNRVPWVKQAEENVSTIADIVRRLEALEAKQPAAPEHNIGDRVILSATVTGINKGRVNVVLDGVPSPGRSLAVPAASLRAA